MRLARHVALQGEALVGKLAGKILGKPRHICKDITESHFQVGG
jgi:hypothetical protein